MSLLLLRRSVLCVCIFVTTFPIFAQEQLGMRLERYAGGYGAVINPAVTAFNPNRWEVNLGAAGVFLTNNYLFIQNTSLFHTLRNAEKIRSIKDFRPETPIPDSFVLVDFFNADREMHGGGRIRVSGPAVSVRLGTKHVLGLSVDLRSDFSMYGIPAILSYDRIGYLRRRDTATITPMTPTAAAWGEIALHYSHRNTNGNMVVAWGITPKFLLGLEGGFGRMESSFNYNSGSGTTGTFASGDWEYGVTSDNVSAAAQEQPVRARVNGSGLGIDGGISWAMPVEGSDVPEDYQWRAGVSLVDVGVIHFDGGAQVHHIKFDTPVTISTEDFEATDAQGYIADASRVFLGDSTRSLQARAFNIGLPSALSLQFDYQVVPHFYVSALLTQRLKLSEHTIQRPNTFAVVPRFEHRWFSVSVPVVLDDWQSLRMGLAARLGFLVIGSDQLGSLFKQKQFTGTDLYVGLKINGFSIPKRERYQKDGHGKRNVRRVKCFDF